MAIQCDTDRLSSCIQKGDILFSRKVPKEAWKSNLSSTRIYAIVLDEDIYIVRIENNDFQGITIVKDDRDLPGFIRYEDIREIWSPISKWSHHVMVKSNAPLPGNKLDVLSKFIEEQNDSIEKLRSIVQKMEKESFANHV